MAVKNGEGKGETWACYALSNRKGVPVGKDRENEWSNSMVGKGRALKGQEVI